MTKNSTKSAENSDKKVSTIFNTLKPYVINIILTIAIFLIQLFVKKLFPFGPYVFATNDAFYQYQPMIYNFLTSIKEGILSNYSFITGLGGSFIFNYVYYLSSPINLVALPFDNPNAIFIVIIIAKLVITSITTTFYTLKRTNNKLLSTIVAISYTFSAWFLAYGKNIMWIDAFMMFPLFQYGLEKLLNENKIYIYIFSLAYIMIANFYIAFMICLYTLIYFIYYIVTKKEKIAKKLKAFNTISLATGLTLLLAFWYIYMTYDSFMSIGLTINQVSEDLNQISILNLIRSFFCGNVIMPLFISCSVFPNIALSTLFTISLLYFFINPKITLKEKIKLLIMFILTILAVYSKVFNYIMNCFHLPAGYTFRYSFLISFFLIKIFIKNYNTFENKIYKRIYFVNITLAILLLIEFIFKNVDIKMLIFNAVSLLIFTLLFIFYKNNKIYKFIFTAAVLVEVGVSCVMTFGSDLSFNPNSFSFQKETTTYRENLDYSRSDHHTYNLNLYDNKSTIVYFSSMYYGKVINTMGNIACNVDNKASIFSCEKSPIYNTLFNIKTDSNYYLEKIFAADKNVLKYTATENTYIGNQNLLLESLAGVDNALEQNLKPVKNQKNHYKVAKDGIYYMPTTQKYAIIINDEAYTYNKELITEKGIHINRISGQFLLEFPLKKNDKIQIFYEKDVEEMEHPYIYYFNQESFENAYQELKNGEIKYTSYSDNKIEGTIEVDKDEIIFTTIPYDKHWKVKIDGKEVNTTYAVDALLAIETTPGKHKISLEYITDFKIPFLISGATFIGLIASIIISKRKQKKNEN